MFIFLENNVQKTLIFNKKFTGTMIPIMIPVKLPPNSRTFAKLKSKAANPYVRAQRINFQPSLSICLFSYFLK